MTIEFTQEDLDYLAVKIAEIIGPKTVTPADIQRAAAAGKADTPVRDFHLSSRLEAVLRRHGVLDWTLREIAYYRSDEYKRFNGLGRISYTELANLVASAGLKFGSHRFPRGESPRNIIIEKPTARL